MRAKPHSLLVIDGAYGEGGGALLRTSLVMSALTQQAVRIQDVRGSTKHPGLDPEDLTLINALSSICKADTEGVEIGSKEISFSPTARPAGFKGELKSIRNESQRGSNALVVLGSLLPVLARSGVYSTVAAEGETYGPNTVSYDYFANVTLAALRKAGLYAFPELSAGGFGRESNGMVLLDVEPSGITGIDWSDRGGLQSVHAWVTTSSLPGVIGERILSHIRQLGRNAGLKMDARHVEIEAQGPGAFVTAWAVYERGIGGGTAIGSRGVRGEMLAHSAFDELVDWMASPATVDPFLADQLLLPLVVADGPSTFSVSRLTQRFLTSVWVIKQFTPIHITVRGAEGGPGVVQIRQS